MMLLTSELYSLCQSLVISIFSIFTSFSCAVDDTWKVFYNHHPAITLVVDYSLFCIRYVHSILYNYYTFPFQNNWVAFVHIDNVGYGIHLISYLDQAFYYFKETELKNINYINYFIETKSKFHDTKNYSLIFLKINDYQIIRNKYLRNIGEKTKEVKNPFLQISYHHPKMETSIDLNLDKSYFIKNNELLSACFILMILSYQSQPFIFDTKYSIKIMDNEINQITLEDGQFIRLLDKGYEIVTIKK